MNITRYNYKCAECGQPFDKPEEREDYRGEFWGIPAYETICVCPYCGSDEILDYEEDEDEEI